MLRSFLLFLFFLCWSVMSTGQEYNTRHGKAKVNKNFCFRAETGLNKSWFAGLGASYVYSNINVHVPDFISVYAAADINLRSYGPRTPFYTIKGGLEGGNIILYGIEFRQNLDFAGRYQFMCMPKIGITLFGQASLTYGRSVFRSDYNIFGITHSQIALSVNINRKVLTESIFPH